MNSVLLVRAILTVAHKYVDHQADVADGTKARLFARNEELVPLC